MPIFTMVGFLLAAILAGLLFQKQAALKASEHREEALRFVLQEIADHGRLPVAEFADDDAARIKSLQTILTIQTRLAESALKS